MPNNVQTEMQFLLAMNLICKGNKESLSETIRKSCNYNFNMEHMIFLYEKINVTINLNMYRKK